MYVAVVCGTELHIDRNECNDGIWLGALHPFNSFVQVCDCRVWCTSRSLDSDHDSTQFSCTYGLVGDGFHMVYMHHMFTAHSVLCIRASDFIHIMRTILAAGDAGHPPMVVFGPIMPSGHNHELS